MQLSQSILSKLHQNNKGFVASDQSSLHTDDSDQVQHQKEKKDLILKHIQKIFYGEDLEYTEEAPDEDDQQEYHDAFHATAPNVYIDLVPMNDMQKALIYHDAYPLLAIRKALLIKVQQLSNLCMLIIRNWLFEYITLTIIILNSVVLALDDPTTTNQQQWEKDLDLTFLILYSIEMILKVMAMGFIFN